MAMEEQEKQLLDQTSDGDGVIAAENHDEANKALVDALQGTFRLLKLLMIGAVIWYIGYGAFQVKPEEVALVKRFGKVVGSGENRELKQGLHWAWPYPIDDRIIIRKDQRSTTVEAWYSMTDKERIANKKVNFGRSLVPGRDRFVLTADANILHVSMIVKYRVVDAYSYVSSIQGAGDPLLKNPEVNLIQTLTDSAVVKAAGQFNVDGMLGPEKLAFSNQVKRYLDGSLRSLNCGLQLEEVLIKKIEPPGQVVKYFNEVRNSAEYMHGNIQAAMGDREQRLTQTAGQGYSELITAIEAEQKLEGTSGSEFAAASKEVAALLSQSGGAVQEILDTSRIYRTNMVESAKADAEYLQALLPEFQKNPKVVLSRLLLSTFESSLSSVRKWYLPKDVYRVRMQLDRDPDELRLMQQEQQQRQMQEQMKMRQQYQPSAGPGGPGGGPMGGPPR